MKKTHKFKWVGFVLSCMLLLTSCAEKPEKQEKSSFKGEYEWELQDFNAITQDAKSVTPDDFKGEAWIANFIFTRCSTVCPPMTANMARLQQKLQEENASFRMISFSVDPERDTPETLKEYAEKYEADFNTWTFLTGYTDEEVKAIAKNFKTLAEREEGTDQYIHSTKIFLINKEGNIVKGYNGIDVPYDDIVNDLKLLNE